MTQSAFDFGQNWKEFSEQALTEERFQQARADFSKLMEGIPLKDRTFIDIGFGQGLSLLCAIEHGAKVHGLDINPKCRDVFVANRERLNVAGADAEIAVGSILDGQPLDVVRAWQPGGYDVVHSWGVLHHTGRMWQAIENAASLVRPGGHLVIAIYNRHWSSLPWLAIKRLYVALPKVLQSLMNRLFVPVIYVAKLLVTGRNPLKMERGMDFYYNVVDWVGGYPYEYASRNEIETHASRLGFTPVNFTRTIVPIGCNEFVFRRDS
ncbi:class I SAM-dependent methyltransferase [Lysobacter panacisoli]|uniref:Class I SAM-dependent methyltransferase n=1 Tax=Lysobacter panacisoli TaxID=1255263 RepID=A0ABP9L835_9GAMM|nr:class I SAM-dependent methyltransferase [Lysobacter panacisoli]